DTASEASGNLDTFLLSQASSQIVINLDTFNIDTVGQMYQILRREGNTSINSNYILGVGSGYNNLIDNRGNDVFFIIDTLSTGAQMGSHFLAVENRNIRFRYLDTIRTGLYPVDTVSSFVDVYDTLILDGSSNSLIVNFDTFNIDV